ncbi:HK97 gp10 family phage protein [Aerococcaceae bacterium NML191219]|nr:HK97 gp10 family phage protein [Aerococcaceae bacterium NML191219]
MSGDGFEFADWEEYQDNLLKAEKIIDEEFMKAALEIGREFIRKVQKRTPIGKTEELYRHWRTTAVKEGDSFVIYIYNPMSYSSYVEDGHRTRKGKGKKSSRINAKAWVEGRKMMALTMDEIEQKMPSVVQKIEKRLSEMLNGN